MKKYILILGLTGMLGISAGFTSCAPDYETEFNVSTLVIPDKSQATIIFPLTGGESNIEVQTNVPFENWQATSNAEWCTIVRQKNKVVVSASENYIYKQRQAEITISYGHQSYSIKVTQFGHEPVILVGDEMQKEGYVKNIDAESKTMTILVATNLELDNIIIPDTCKWIHLPEQPKASKKTRADDNNINQYDLTFTLDQNTDTVIRHCTIILQSSQNYNYTTSFVIKQQKRGYIVEIEDAKKEYQVKATTETITIPFKVNGPSKAYTYEIEASAQSWISPAPATRTMRDAYESFIIQPNTAVIEQPREGRITFRSTDPISPNQFIVTVKQAGFIPVPPANVVNPISISGAGFIKLQWEVPENADFVKIEVTYCDQVTKENKKIEINDYKITSSIIDDTYQCAGEYTFTIKTYGPTGLETDHPAIVKGTSGEASSIERVALTADMLSANATEPTEGKLAYLVDNSTAVKEYYHTMWSLVHPQKEAHYVQINLLKPLQNLRFEYDSRRDVVGTGDVKRASVWGSNSAIDDSWERIGTETFNMPASRGERGIPNENIEGKQPFKHIRFTPEARRNQDPLIASDKNKAWWCMSKIYLYRIRHDEAWAEKELGL